MNRYLLHTDFSTFATQNCNKGHVMQDPIMACFFLSPLYTQPVLLSSLFLIKTSILGLSSYISTFDKHFLLRKNNFELKSSGWQSLTSRIVNNSAPSGKKYF